MGPIQEEITAKMYVRQERIEASMTAWREGSKACLERKDPTPVEIANVATQFQDFNGVMREETILAIYSLCKDQHLAVRRRLRQKKDTQGVGGSWKKLVAACRWMTRCAIPAWHKGHS
jgi:hypothetical protein